MSTVPKRLGAGVSANRDESAASIQWPAIAAIILIAAAGLYIFFYQLRDLWDVWTSDALRSIGLLIPPVSLWLALRAWRGHDWRAGGSWWGLAILVAAMALGLFAAQASLIAQVPDVRGAALNLLPASLPIFVYVSGAVVLFGGIAAWRKAWFPLLLLLLMQPVPDAFQVLVDLPLQYIGASVARGFAALINVPVSGDLLKLMFAPELGMYIAPGCSGLRGAVAMGYLALVAGYLHQMPRGRWGLYVLGAVALAYLFNLLRLCALVIYYWFALRFPAIDDYGVQVDYAIGGCLFLGAALFVLGVARRWQAP